MLYQLDGFAISPNDAREQLRREAAVYGSDAQFDFDAAWDAAAEDDEAARVSLEDATGLEFID